MALSRRLQLAALLSVLLAAAALGYWWLSQPQQPQSAAGPGPGGGFVEIEDGMTLEPGPAGLVQRAPTAEESERMQRALKEMEEAMQGIEFSVPEPAGQVPAKAGPLP